ncbi:MAG: trimethylamine methyltransferase family protein, partial [Anaerolineales bacterium]|nr:trimethylamine methyltransferase family protein [Anaerolineales bacterium]
FETWQVNGGLNAEQRANQTYKDLLAHYEPPPLDPGVEDGLRDFVARRERELEGVNLYDKL